MSAEDAPDDAAKTRAEERAERELQLKIDTLELERDKFRYSYRQGFFDRLGTASVRGAAALLFANGSTILLAFTSYKSLLDTFTPAIMKQSAFALFAGFILASVAFIAALILSVQSPDLTKERDPTGLFFAWMCGLFALSSLGALAFALLQPVVFLRTH